MLKEFIATGKTIDEAVKAGCEKLGVSQEECDIEIIDKPKRSLFGKLKVEAKVRLTVKETEVFEEPVLEAEKTEEKPSNKSNQEEKLQAAVSYLKDILKQMNLERVEIVTEEKEDSAVLTLKGEDLGILIGRHGETLDSLQYLASLVCNRVEGNYYRITLDCGNYREKREEALKELAKKISMKVKRTGRSQMLEPMNPYERRIIHAVLSDVEGITSKSKGDEPNRRVVIIPTNRNRGGYRQNHKSSYNKPRRSERTSERAPERTMEQILKGELTETEKNTKLYSKIEL